MEKLILNEKKIRKGKPIGLPYVGSKKKISKKIIEIIKQNFGVDKPIYDVFGGGGAITAECILNGLEVHYNDKNTMITRCFEKVVNEDREYIKSLLISYEEFQEILKKEEKTVTDYLKLLVNSFGNNCKDYLYGKHWRDMKYNLGREIINKHDVFSGYKQTVTYTDKAWRLQQLGQLEQLEQLQRLQQLGQLEITNEDYTHFSNVKDAIFYLDPPYQNAVNHYDGEHGSDKRFDHDKFYNWAYEMSKTNIVLISSYEIDDPRFEVVFEFKTARSTLQGGQQGRHEKLFMVKGY